VTRAGHGLAVLKHPNGDPGHAPPLTRLRGPFRQVFRRNPPHKRLLPYCETAAPAVRVPWRDVRRPRRRIS